jgi:uncharacterized protein YjbJ (UPF0337 family)
MDYKRWWGFLCRAAKVHSYDELFQRTASVQWRLLQRRRFGFLAAVTGADFHCSRRRGRGDPVKPEPTPIEGILMFEKTEGTVQNIAGKVQDAFGAATGDGEQQIKGKARQVAGKAQESYGEVLDTVRDAAVSNPLGTLAVVAGAGFILGALWSRH